MNVLHKAVGEISESDVTLAAASDAIIIGFQVRPSVAARRAAERDGVQIRLYSVIYQAIEEVKDAMAGLLARGNQGRGNRYCRSTGDIPRVEGGHYRRRFIVREGKLKRGCKVRLIRDGIVRYTGDLGSLKRFKDDAKEVLSGFDCGVSIADTMTSRSATSSKASKRKKWHAHSNDNTYPVYQYWHQQRRPTGNDSPGGRRHFVPSLAERPRCAVRPRWSGLGLLVGKPFSQRRTGRGCVIDTSPAALHTLLDALQAIERSISPLPHRNSDGTYRDRGIDIDIIALDTLVYSDERLSIPHPPRLLARLRNDTPAGTVARSSRMDRA